MKKNLLYLFALICSMSLFTACGDDDPVYPIEEELAGTYKGELAISVDGANVGSGIIQRVYISKFAAGNNQVKLELKDFNFSGMLLGDIVIEPCAVTESNGAYSFTGSQTVTLAAPIGACPVTVSGTITGSKISISIGVKAVALGQDVVVAFDGAKLTGNESTEAKITGFTFDNGVVLDTPVIDEAKGSITFYVKDASVEADLQALVPIIVISDKAVVAPASGVAQNFNKSVKYTVYAEDGTSKEYTVSIAGRADLYTFDEWTIDLTQSGEEFRYPVIGDYKKPEWATCNGAVMFIKAFGSMAKPNPIVYTGGWPVNSTEDRRSGTHALEMVSIDTQGSEDMLEQVVPKVTAGSAFLGKMNPMNALGPGGALSTTMFGNMYTKKPMQVKGYFKYQRGTEFYDHAVLQEGVKDYGSVAVVLYKVASDKASEILDGTNIYTSDKVVAMSALDFDESATFKPFDVELTYTQEYDPNALYRFAIIFSASKEGAAYRAAIGSKLIIDDVTVVVE